MNFLIETTRSDSRRVQSILMIRGSDDHDSVVLLEAVKLCENLVDRCSR